jgi:hypothetical protein
MHMRGCKCEDITCCDRAIEDIRDAFDTNLDEIEPGNSENIRRHPQEIIDEYNGRQASIDDSGTVRRDHSEVGAGNEEQLVPQDDEDSLTISIFLKKIAEDIDLARTVSRHQLGIPGWLYPNTTMDEGSSDMRDVVQTTRPATTRTNQSRENGSLGCSTANLDHMQENGRRDSPQDDRVDDKKDDLAWAMDVKNVREYDVDGDRIPFYWPPFRKGPPTIFLPHKPAQMEGGRRKVSPPDRYDQVIIEWCCGRNSMLGKSSKHSSGCKVVRLTIDDDLRTSEGLRNAIQVIQVCPRGRTLLWSSMPCAGGSPWQTLNAAMGEDWGRLKAIGGTLDSFGVTSNSWQEPSWTSVGKSS